MVRPLASSRINRTMNESATRPLPKSSRTRPGRLRYGRHILKLVLTVSPTANLRSLLSYLILTTPLIYGDRARLHLAPSAVVNNALFNLASGEITVEDHVVFGHSVALLTGTHDFDQPGEARAQAVLRSGRDILVEQGAWLASNVVVLGNCRIGANAVVAAGSVVTHDIPASTLVAGVPARVIRTFSGAGGGNRSELLETTGQAVVTNVGAGTKPGLT